LLGNSCPLCGTPALVTSSCCPAISKMASAHVEVPEDLEDGIDTMEMALRMSSMRAASPPPEAESPTATITPRSAEEPQPEEAAPSEPEPIIAAQPEAPEMEPTAPWAPPIAPEMEPTAWAPTPLAAPEMEPTAWAPTPLAAAPPQMPPPMEPQAAFQAAPPVRRPSLPCAVPLAAQGSTVRMVSQTEVRAMPKAGAPASVVYRVAPAKVQISQPLRVAPAGSPTLLNAMGGAVPTAATTHCLGMATVVQRSATLGYSS